MAKTWKKIRTMASDITDYNTKPNPRHIKPYDPTFGLGTPKIKKRRWPKILFWLIFVLALAGAGWYVYTEYFSPEARKVPDENIPEKLLNADEKVIRIASSKGLAEEISKLERLQTGKFQIVFISETKKEARHFLNPLEFFYAAELHPPEKLFNSIEHYNFGIVGGEDRNYPFLILKISSDDLASEGLAIWEKYLPLELSSIFILPENLDLLRRAKFENSIIKNQNVRIFYASSTQIVLSIYNQNLVIIASSQKSFEEIISRYSIFPPN